MLTLSLNNDFIVICTDNYRWIDANTGIVCNLINQYDTDIACFYTDYIDKNNKYQVQKCYDRFDIINKITPKLCFILRKNMFSDVIELSDDFFKTMTEKYVIIHLPIICFQEVDNEK